MRKNMKLLSILNSKLYSKLYLIFALFCFFNFNTIAKELYFPPILGNQWETQTPESLNWETKNIPELYQYLESQNTKAFLVLKDGKIVIEKYFDNFTADSNWYWASAGKSLTAFTIGVAESKGQLNLTDKTSKYLGEGWTSLDKELEDKITVWNQLTMTTGLNDKKTDTTNSDCTDPDCLNYLADAGKRWAYHNAPYTLLDKVLENATGQNLNTYIAQNISNKTGIYGLFFKLDFNNVFISKPRVMARFGLLMLNNGNWVNEVIISNKDYLNNMINTSQELNKSYGYLWWLNGKESFMLPTSQFVFNGSAMADAPDDMYGALGKNGQILNIIPSQNLIVVRMGDDGSDNFVPTNLNNEIMKRVMSVVKINTSIDDDNFSNQFIINSTRNNIEIKNINANKNNEVKIYNLLGIEIFNQEFTNNLVINRNLIIDKFCFINIVSQNQSYTYKLVLE